MQWSGESSGFAVSRPGGGEAFAALRSRVGLGLVRARPQDGGWGNGLQESRGGDRKKCGPACLASNPSSAPT